MKVIYQGRPWEDGDAPSLEVNDVCGLPDAELCELLGSVLETMRDRKHLDTAKQIIQRHLRLVTPEESAAIGGLKPRSTEIYYYDNYSMKSLKIDEEIPEYKLKEIKANTSFFVCVELPPKLRSQIDDYIKKLALEARKKAAKKREKEIAKAKKLLTKIKEYEETGTTLI